MTQQNRPRQLPIAVVGVGALIPGAQDAAGFWRTVLAGEDHVTDVPRSHWLVEDYYDADPSAPDKTYGRRGAFLDPVEFDPLAYGVPPNALSSTDTSQLLALMVADQVLNDVSGGDLNGLDRDRVSVILGAAPLDLLATMANRLQRPVWLKSLRETGIEESQAQEVCDRIAAHYVPWTEASFPGLLSNVVAGRIANRFDLHGTNCTTDAACASSLAAMSHAASELSLGNADLVITGGVDTLNDIVMYMCFSKTPALSATGDCRPFSDQADGTILGEALVMVALKRLDDAERDGDEIYAVLKGIGTASDGRSTAIYAPLPEGQTRALNRAYEAAGYGPETVGLVEAHGTGTKAGDLAEFTALRNVFADSGRTGEPWCALGSIKSQIGHTKGAAGAAGLLKAVFALHQKVLPPTIKVDRPNPAFDLADSPLYVNTEARPWISANGTPRRASVSSFGFGGSNFHLTLEEYAPGDGTGTAPRRVRSAPTELVVLSADSPAALAEQARAFSGTDLAAAARRSQREFRQDDSARLAVVAGDADDLAAKLTRAAASIETTPESTFSAPGVSYAAGTPVPGEIAFLFSGQGSQYVGMGADLAMEYPRAREAWDWAAGIPFGDRPLASVVFPRPVFSEEDRAAQQELLTETEWAQPALGVQSLAQLNLLRDLGIRPDRVAGHSFGELVALHAAGAYDEETLVRLARRRGERMRDAATSVSGAMLAVKASRAVVDRVVAELGGRLWIANHNAPEQIVVSGSEDAIAEAARVFTADRIAVKRLNAATAFHTPLVADASEPLLGFLVRQRVTAPGIPVYGNADAAVYPAEADLVRALLAEHLARPVRFVEQIEAMYADGVRTFVEVGAGSALTGLVGQILGDRPHLAVSLDRKGRNGITALHEALGRLAVAGVAVDFEGLWADFPPYEEEQVSSKPRMTTTLSGTNYGKPYPPIGGAAELPAPNPPRRAQPDPAAPVTVQPMSAAPVTWAPAEVSGAQEQWLRVFRETQQESAEVHLEYQRVMAESHLAYLRLAESTLSSAMPGAVAAPAPVLDAPLPVPLPAAPVPVERAEPAESATTDDVEAVLLAVVAEKTGYPVEMLDAGMELEGDLGIDSIKRVEILSGLRERIPGLPEVNVAELGKLRSLGEIIARLHDTGSAEPAPEIEVTQPLSRTVPDVVTTPACGKPLPGLDGRPLVVTDDDTGVAPLLVSALAAHGIDAVVADEVPPGAQGVIFLGGIREIGSTDEAIAINHEAFRAARAFAVAAAEPGGVFVTVQDTGGDFGLRGSAPERAWLGGLAALARTCAREWPRATVKAIDVERGDRGVEQLAAVLAAELLGGGDTTDVGLRSGGSRVVLKDVEVSVVTDAAGRIGPESVIVATGGARGVTAAALRELARSTRPRIVLIGRTRPNDEDAELTGRDEAALKKVLLDRARAQGRKPKPKEISREVADILAAREVRATLAALADAGSPVRYVALDIRDADALAAALAEVRAEWGPITGLVHAAGVLADKRIADKTDEQFARVFDTKVTGLRALLAETATDPLDLVCVFSSVAARFGNVGQADYAMANEVMNQVIAAEAAKRPGAVVRSIAWGPWEVGMVDAALAEHFRTRGVPMIPQDVGARAFVAELADTTAASVVIAAGDPAALGGGADRGGEVTEITVCAATHPYLADHDIAGTPVLPVAMVLEWFAAASGAPGPLVLRDVAVLRRVALDRFGTGEHLLRVRDHDGVLALLGEGDTVHYRATVDSPSGSDRDWSVPADLDHVGMTGIYDGTVLFHGPAFQAVRSVQGISASGAVAQVCGAGELGWPGARVHTDPAAVDGGLQLALLWAEQALGWASLPMGVDEFRLLRPGACDQGVRCVVLARDLRESRAICDVGLLGADGRPIAELLGVSLVKRPE